ncbi:hypothetical protein SAMN02745702_00232 [Desulfobaculum bizertense DSM 18034]|uniref:Helix-turn-helix n=1 Tax=Desulfobaculum bizertense DSM 18034 TaxID=1121442 RepID=A0A1T4VH82_9BACT|nr:hypothetical protein SAMN02745702_00232 [Desulfobaculum bizertense DSM 18034]
MQKQLGKIVDRAPANRQAALRAWLAYHDVQMKDLAHMIGVHPSMMTHIVKGNRSPAKRIEQLVALGVPRHLLPSPSRPPGRPPRKAQFSVD